MVVENGDQGNQDDQDFYWEDGLMVFTATYHLKRGYCCQSGCRHCPYGFEKKDKSEDRNDKKTD